MTTTSDSQTKARAVFFAFVMITSMVAAGAAFSGSVAAQQAGGVTVTDGGAPENVTIQSSDFTQETTGVAINNSTSSSSGFSGDTVKVYHNITNVSSPGNVDLDSASIGLVTINDTSDSPSVGNIDKNINTNSGVSVAEITFNNVDGNFTYDWNLTQLDTSGADSTVAPLEYDLNATVGDTSDSSFDGSSGDAPGADDVQSSSFGIDKETQLISHSTNDVTDANAEVNVTITEGVGVDEGSINVNVTNDNTSETIDLVNDGEFTDVVDTSASSGLDGSNDDTEVLNISAPLQEGNYSIGVSANDTNGELNATEFDDVFQVDMAGDSLKVVTDDTGPGAGENASVSVVAVDKNGNELIFNESDVGMTKSNLRFAYSDAENKTNYGTVNTTSAQTRPIYNTSFNGYNLTYDISYSEVGDLEITARDFGGNLTQGSATQTYTAAIAGVNVFAEDGTLVADGVENETVYLQLVDQNDNPVPRQGVNTEFGIISGNAGSSEANVSLNSPSASPTTNSSGIAMVKYNATAAGYTIEVAGETTSTSTTYDDTTTFETTPGGISNADSQLTVAGESDSITPTVATEHEVVVDIQDNQQNGIQGVSVDLSSNDSAVSFDSPTVTTNSSGLANTTVTLSETKGTYAINATANGYNASQTDRAQVMVTTQADNVTDLAFSGDSRTVPSGSSAPVTVQPVDTYDNVNTTYSEDVTLSSNDVTVLDFGADTNESTTAADSGSAEFTVEANATSGSTELTATSGNFSVSDTWSIGSAQSANVWFAHDVSTSSGAQQQTTAYAQLLDDNGNPISIANENITFTLNGDSAELNQSQSDFVNATNSTGVAQFGVNATSTTGDATVQVFAENFSLEASTGTVTTTGPATTVAVEPESSSSQVNNAVNVTVYYADSEGRMVPKTTDLTVQSSLGGSSVSSNTATPTLMQDSGASATVSLNSTSAGTTEISAFGSGVSGSDSVTFTAPAESDQVNLSNINLDPSSVESNTTNNHTLTFDALNVSDDGNTDDFTVTIPSAATLESANSVSVVDANGSNVSLSGGPDTSGNTIAFDVSPDSDADFRDLTVTADVTVSAPNVSETTEADITIDVADSSNGDASATTTLTVTPEGASEGPAVVGDSPATDIDGDGTFEDVNGDGTFDIVDVNAIFQNRNSDAVQNNGAAFDFNGDGTFDIVDVNSLFQQSQA